MQSPLYMEILTELQRQMGSVGDLRETNRASPLFSHLSAVSEGITALGWITIEPKPADYIAEAFGSAQFFGNRVLKEYKERFVYCRHVFRCHSIDNHVGIENMSNGFKLSIRSSRLLAHMSNNTTLVD